MVYMLIQYLSDKRRKLINIGESYFVMHIPKTGLTTLRFSIYKYFKQYQILPNYDLLQRQNRKYLSQPEMIKSYDITCFPESCKMIMALNKLSMLSKFSSQTKVISIIREPVKRSISHIKPIKRNNFCFQDSSVK